MLLLSPNITAALAECADTGLAFAVPPAGFSANGDITMTGTLAITKAGVISGSPTFYHTNTGTVTYTINTNGGVD